MRQKFTSYERDSETDLDFAQARVFRFCLGRFESPDSANCGAFWLLPQTWNGYVYVLNNPLTLTDPTGLIWLQKNGTDSYYWIDDEIYNKNKEGYKGFTPANDTIIRVTGGSMATSDQIGQLVVLASNGEAYTISEFDLALGTVYAPAATPFQELAEGAETVLWWGRPFVYALSAAMLPAAAPIAVAGGGSGAGGAYLSLGLRAATTAVPAVPGLAGKDQQIINLAVDLGARGNAS